MRFQVECFENVEAFVPFDSPYRQRGVTYETFPFDTAPLRRVMNLTVEAETSMGAADEAFHIGNAPWSPADAEGVAWDPSVRSMSSSDVVLVHTPDGPVAYGCLSFGWKRLERLPLSIEAALA